MNRGDKQLHVELAFAHHAVSWLVGMLQGAPTTVVVAWRLFSPYLSLYLNTSDNDDGCMNE